MKIAGQELKIVDTFDRIITVPDCFVVRTNKIGHGNGEAKLYIADKPEMYAFFGTAAFRQLPCFLVKSDLIQYLTAVKEEYFNPRYNYAAKDDMRTLWEERMRMVADLPEIIEFRIDDQDQIAGPRGYIKSADRGYQLLRDLSLPLITYISAMAVRDLHGRAIRYYFKLFVDFEALEAAENEPLVFRYGKALVASDTDIPVEKKKDDKSERISRARVGQGKYRDDLLAQCPYCPITQVNEERLLIASHIKPWAVSDDKEKIDPYNGYMLSPLYDRLFDRGFITFTDERRMQISNWLSPANVKRLGLKNNQFYQKLPMDDQRKHYLEYHRQYVYMH